MFLTNGVPLIYSDGWGSYHIAKSIVENGRFVSNVEPEYWNYIEHGGNLYRDQFVTVYAPGAGVLNVPGLLVVELFEGDSKSSQNDYFYALNGHSLYEGISFLITAMLFGLATIYLIYKTLRKLDFSKKNSVITTFSSYVGSYAIWYVFLNSAFGHTYDLFGIALAFFGITKYEIEYKADFKKKIMSLILVGLGFGVATLTRPILVLPTFLFGIYLIYKKRLKDLIYFVFSGLPFAIILFLYNQISYGKPIASGYSEIWNQTFQTENFYLLQLLFSPIRGWFVYSPIFLISIIGLIWMAKTSKQKFIPIFSIISILSIIIVYSFWPQWWGGGSYGMRFLIPATPFASVGIAYAIQESKKIYFKGFQSTKILLTIVTIFTMWTALLTTLYRVTPVAGLIEKEEGVDYGTRGAENSYTPYHIFEYHYNLLFESESLMNYIKNLAESFNGGNSLLMYYIGVYNSVVFIDDRNLDQITLKRVDPKYKSQGIPNQIKFLIRNQENKLFEVTISDFNTYKNFELRCSNLGCQADSKNLEIVEIETVEKIEKLKVEAISIPNSSLEFYFFDAENLLFRGQPINLSPEEEYYIFSL